MPQIEISDYTMNEINETMLKYKHLKTPDDVIQYWLSDLDGFIYGCL